MSCNVDLVKTLTNTADKNVFDPHIKVAAITWSPASAEYKGRLTGVTSQTVPFKYAINDTNALERDFTCYPEKIAVITTGANVSTQFKEFIPFSKGRVSLVTGELYTRDLSYGNEQNSYHDVKSAALNLSSQFDNKGVVTIKGISYPLDFEKEYK